MRLFLLVFLAASIFRLTNMNLIEFKGDEAINLYLAAQPIFGKIIPYGANASSVMVLNPPLLSYILFPLTITSLDPRVITFFIALINSVSIALFFLIIKKYYNKRIAFFSSILLAFSPWSIIYSRKIWPPDFYLPLLVILLLSFFKITKDKETKFWILYSISSLFLIQLNLSNVIFILIISIFLFLKTKADFKKLFIGILIGLIPLFPYASYEIKNNCPDCRPFLKGAETLNIFSSENLIRPFQIVGAGDFHFIMGDDIIYFFRSFPIAYNLKFIFYFEYLILILGTFVFLFKRDSKEKLLLYTILALPLTYFLFRFIPHMHYFALLIPFLFLFIGFGINFIYEKNKYLGLGTFLLLMLCLFYFNFAFFNFLSRTKKLGGDYGKTYILTLAETKKFLKGFEKDPYYKEMFLAYSLPKEEFYSAKNLAKMLYPYEKTQKDLSALEERLKKVPVDPRVQNQLIAFYSKDLNKETLRNLNEKSKQIKGYQFVFAQLETLYSSLGQK